MSEPISGTGAVATAVTGVTIVGVFSNLDPAVVVGAFAGAAVFVLSSSDLPNFKKIWMLSTTPPNVY
ncbi:MULTISPECIES: putative holin [unclassified Serratia (in: enterobacteria)]|uniref:putative holin n=1 Tax=unclassified Serratia (in: enterobacteria) TaxID=2647522 RepID=UPI00307650DC